MGNADEFFNCHVTSDNHIHWPSDRDEQRALGRALLGCFLVGSLDSWIDLATDYIVNAEPSQPFPRRNKAWERDTLYRSVFRTLNAEQRDAVLKLIREVASGVLLSSLVQIDQFPPADVEISLVERDQEAEKRRVNIAAGEGDLHDDLFDWIDRFSKHAAAFDSDS